jgi:uncharacterized DUF497 family protein
MPVVWTEYLKHRARLRGFDLAEIEEIVRFSDERYFDTATQRRIAIGRHGRGLVMIPYEEEDDMLTPITVHATTRQQTNLRVRVGRYRP